jgi:hypothetical protein
MQGYYETPTDNKELPNATDDGLEIASFAQDGRGNHIITLIGAEDRTAVTVTLDSVPVSFIRLTPDVDFFTGPAAG